MPQEQPSNTEERLDLTSFEQDVLDLAHSVAVEVADNPDQVGQVVAAYEIEPHVVDFRITAHMKGYEGWQWSVTLYHDSEREQWTVNESSLIPGADSLLPPQWIPWKDRLLPSDLSVTDVLGTELDDKRLEEGFRKTRSVDEVIQDIAQLEASHVQSSAVRSTEGVEADAEISTDTNQEMSEQAQQDIQELQLVEEMELSRRRVLTPYGRAQAAERWYSGQHGPKSLSTKAADGSVCQTCGFFVPLSGELNLMFGVCANVWSPDDGRVVSRDHGCGQHSDIEPLTPTHLWVQPKPAFDDMHIDIAAQAPRVERESIDALEQAAQDQPTDQTADQTAEQSEDDTTED